MTDLERIIESYMPAARILGLTEEEVEEAVIKAIRLDKMCSSCRHSQAPTNAMGIARKEDFLPIFNRSCLKRRPVGIMGCARWEALEIPEEDTALGEALDSTVGAPWICQ